MIPLKTAALGLGLGLGFAQLSSTVRAAVVEVASVTDVTEVASLYDLRLAADGGCDPAGCTAALTRDGDTTTVGSRWSCKPDLLSGDASACSIVYSLADEQTIESLEIAMYKSDERSRTINVYVDDAMIKSWTSSGATVDFENVELGVTGQTIELRGVLEGSEWLSIKEVQILVDDGMGDGGADVDGADPMVVEAGTLGTVTPTAVLYDPRLGSANGCDPDGCAATLTRDGDVSEGSRWSCASSLGGTCSISYDLGAVRDLSELRLAMYKGASRARTVEVYVDDVLATTWTSSGTTFNYESINLSGYSGQRVTITGVLSDMEWLSIVETEIMVLSHGPHQPPSPTTTTNAPAPALAPIAAATPAPPIAPIAPPTPAPVMLTFDEPVPEEVATQGTTITTTTTLFDSRLSSDNGCDPDGCTGALTRDGNMGDASRWSCSPQLGGEGAVCTVSYDLGVEYSLAELRLAMYKGTERRTTLQVYIDRLPATSWTSSGNTDGFETIPLPSGTAGTRVDIHGILEQSEWLSIIETEIMVWPAAPTMAPAPTAPVTLAPVTRSPTPGAVLQPVGLTPLALGAEPDAERFATKDGDLGTSWSCTGDPREPNANGDTYYECRLTFGLVYFRNIKEVKIALPDGADRAVDMRISGRYKGDIAEKLVTSSGTTAGLETYEFDYKLSSVTIAAIFSGPQQTITISEVEIVEEVLPGEVLINTFNTPYDNGDGLWNEPTTSGFEWSSDSDEAIGRNLYFGLAGYFEVTEMQLLFPVGDTFKFDLKITNDLDGTGEPYVTIADLESEDTADWQFFDLTPYATQLVTGITIEVKGRGSGAPGFAMLDANIWGTQTVNPTDTVYVGSTMIEYWDGDGYPDFVAKGTGDQYAINSAICAVKRADYDGMDCVGGDETATGMVVLSDGAWYVDGSIVMKSGVFLKGWFFGDDGVTTDIYLEESAAGDTDMEAIIVVDSVSDAWIEDIWIRGQYDPEANANGPVGPGYGPACLTVTNSQNITLEDIEIRFCDGDAMVVRDSQIVNIDAGRYDDEYLPWTLGRSRGTGLIVDTSDSVWVRRHTLYDNGVAGIHIMRSNNFTFEATVDNIGDEGDGNVGSLDGQQPIEIIIETSTDVKFTDMKVQSLNDPVMTVSDSAAVSFTRCGFSNVESGTCTIQTDNPSTVMVDVDEDELRLQGTCYVKV